jgi:hypothetical protein
MSDSTVISDPVAVTTVAADLVRRACQNWTTTNELAVLSYIGKLEAIADQAREIGEGPHSEICKGKCGMCRALAFYRQTTPGLFP